MDLFGEVITINARLGREVFSLPGGQRKEWKSRPIKPVSVMIIGRRILQNGESDWQDYGAVWYQQGQVRAFLVVADMRRAPFYILESEGLELLPTNTECR